MRALVYRFTAGSPLNFAISGAPSAHDVFWFVIPERGNLLITSDPEYGDHRLVVSTEADLSLDNRIMPLGETDIPDSIVEAATALLAAEKNFQTCKDRLAPFLPTPPPAKFKTGDICQVVQVSPDARFRYSREEVVRVGTEVRIVTVYTGSTGEPWLPWRRVYEYSAVRLKGAPIRDGKPKNERFDEDELALLEAAK